MSERSRLRWLCRRGMKELDVLLSAYLDQVYPRAEAADRRRFEQLLEWPDPELYGLLTGKDSAPDEAMQDFVDRLRRLIHKG
ncbi:MAG: succinate dehydrogenase assembly factor 2 [Gammaproteobacteria bacterium]|nr:succinate dehydrogenase assembly factor 2 [Gammaproteobacteria bacterium]